MTEPASDLAAHSTFDEIEDAFHAALEIGLDPRGPDSLYDVVAGLGLRAGASVVDVGCGRGRQALELARRFGFNVVGVDPVPRHEAVAKGAATLSDGSVRFADGTAEAIPVEAVSMDLVFCRESIMFADLDAAAAEFGRVLRAGGRGLVYLVLTGPRMSDTEADDFATLMHGRWLRPAHIEGALTRAGLTIDESVDYAGEWGERAQEAEGVPGRRLLYASRLLRQPERYVAEFGQDNYEIMLGDCLWHVYRLLGKLTGYACIFTKPAGRSGL
jgi:SAM-dependent methyltransferase